MTATIRHATHQDIAAISALATATFCDNFGHLYAADDLRAHLAKTCSEVFFAASLTRQNETILLAHEGENIVGYAKLGALSLPVEAPIMPACELHRLYLAPSHQGQGLGKRLMQAGLSLDLVAASRAIYVGVWEHNTRAQNFYAKFGFSKVGEYDYVVGQTKDREWMMEKRLTRS